MSDLTGEVTDLLQRLIRNACVNDGTTDSGNETRNADLLSAYFEGSGLALERHETVPGRANLIGRIEGSDPSAPSLMLMGHTDVVPVNPDGWRRDPFGGELVDGEVWGRGAVDMLNLTASMAVAVRRLAERGFRPRGSLVYLGVADEEALGVNGAKWLTETMPDAVRTDYVVTEMGGFRFPLGSGGPRLPLMVAEKGTYWCLIRVRGTPGHASMPHRTDNALVKAAEVVRRLAEYRPPTTIHDVWRRFVTSIGLPPEAAEALLDPARVRELVDTVPELGLARMVHACTHTTFAPTLMKGGVKTNVIPDLAELQVDIRTLPGQRGEDVRAMLEEALGDLAPDVEIAATSDMAASSSAADTPLRDSLDRLSAKLVPGATTVPFLVTGATDSRFFRRIGTVAYGYGLYSERVNFTDFASMFHGDNERIDQESLRLETELWGALAEDFLG
jgi:acetylornithine deacetylase/succinyl-diaminopimelate desuccinylase-like protein